MDDARRVVPHPPLGSACGGQLLTRRAPLNTSSIVSGEGHRRHRHGSLRVDPNVGGARRGGCLERQDRTSLAIAAEASSIFCSASRPPESAARSMQCRR